MCSPAPDASSTAPFARLLRAFRERALLSQEELAARAGLSTRAVSYLESSGGRRPRAASVRLLAEALNLSGEELNQLRLALAGDAPQHRARPATTPPAGKAGPSGPQQTSPLVRPAQLPPDVPWFVGRRDELQRLDRTVPGGDRLGSPALVAICGTAGVGKTALAVHWAHRVRRRFPDGQLFIDLRGYSYGGPRAPADALARLLIALGVAPGAVPENAEDRAGLYRSRIADLRMIIVLDNAVDAEQVRWLLPGTASALTVVTSRNSLNGLVARQGAHRISVGLMSAPEAAELIISGEQPGHRTDRDQLHQLAQQCARLPLALRVAAARVAGSDSISTVLAELTDERKRLDALDADGDSDTAVRAVLSWSYRRLSPETASAFRLLGLHPGPDADATAAAVLADVDQRSVRPLLRDLESNHLLAPTDRGRYAMHDLLHAYARELALEVDGPTSCDAAVSRLFDFYLATTERATRMLVPGRVPDPSRRPDTAALVPPINDVEEAHRWLDGERLVLANPAARPSAPVSVALSRELRRYLYDGAHTVDAEVVHQRALTAAQQTRDIAGEASARHGVSTVRWRWGQLNPALAEAENAVRLAKAAEAQLIEAEARQSAGSIAGQQADYARAEQHFQRALELFQRSAERRGQGEILISLGVLRERRGDLDAATAHYRRGKEVLTEIGDLAGRARALLSLGVVAHQRGDDAAKAYYQDALSALDGAHNPVLEARVLSALADEHVRQDNIPAALDAQVQALDMFRRLGDRNGEGWAQIGAGTCLLAQGQLTAALSAYEQAMAIFNETGDQLGTIDALNSLGDTLRRLNREDDADGHYRRARDLALATGDQPEYDRAVAGLAGRGERFPFP